MMQGEASGGLQLPLICIYIENTAPDCCTCERDNTRKEQGFDCLPFGHK
jgi:hypothetical protein